MHDCWPNKADSKYKLNNYMNSLHLQVRITMCSVCWLVEGAARAAICAQVRQFALRVLNSFAVEWLMHYCYCILCIC